MVRTDLYLSGLTGTSFGMFHNMKRRSYLLNKTFLPAISLLLFIISCSPVKQVNTIGDPIEIEKNLQKKNFIFKAQSALPMRGSAIQLTSDYEVRISGDTLTTYLPYYGRAYTAPMNSSEGGIRFTSTNFQYKVTKAKKGSWLVLIEPLDTKDVREMALQVSSSGYGVLQVSSNNRESISFNGRLTTLR